MNRSAQFILFMLFILFSMKGFATNLGLSDVSVLFPMPASEKMDLLLGGETRGRTGELLPLSTVQKLPALLKIASNEQVYPYIKVMGIRFDPCFAESTSVMRCKKQIRMVWQPVSADDEYISTFDASLHSFYELTESDFQILIIELRNLREKYQVAESGLSINPIIKAEGLEGEYYKQFIAVVLKYVGQANLVRVTFMLLGQDGNLWTFGGFDIENNDMMPIQIPRLKATTTQVFRNSIKPDPTKFNGGLQPEPVGSDLVNFLIKDSDQINLGREQEIRDSVRAAFRIENPQIHNAGTVDCVSCHVVQAARNWTLVKFSSLDFLTENSAFIYKSDFNLANLSPLQNKTNVMRAFGYFLDSPIVSQRTINESAEAARIISQQY